MTLVVSWSTQPLHVFDCTGAEGDGPTPHAGNPERAPSTLRLASANVTSLAAVWNLLPDQPFDLLALQELRISDVEHWKREATKVGLHLIVPDLAPGSEHLVSFLLRTGTLRPPAHGPSSQQSPGRRMALR